MKLIFHNLPILLLFSNKLIINIYVLICIVKVSLKAMSILSIILQLKGLIVKWVIILKATQLAARYSFRYNYCSMPIICYRIQYIPY